MALYFNFLQTISFVYALITITVIVSCSNSLLNLDDECLDLFQFKHSIHRQNSSFGADGFGKFTSWKLTTNASNDGFVCCLWDGVVCSDEDHVIGLDLSESFLRGSITSNSTLFNLVHLQTLNLAMNDFVGSQIPSEIASLKQLRSLNLSASGFSGQIPQEISQLMQLSLLDLSWNPLELRSPSLENLVQNLTLLENLCLSGVDISSSVPPFLANFSSLRSIKLLDCGLQNEFPSAILQHPKIEFLNLGSNPNLTGSLPEFHNNTSLLEFLSLRDTSFSGNIPQSIDSLSRVITLDLLSCSFSGPIPSALANMTQLTFLSLGDNEFIGMLPSLVRLSELVVLEFSYNKFERGSLPDWLGKLTKLEEIYGRQGNIYSEIPPFLANLTKLSIFEISNNSFFGHIPSSFMNLTQLTQVNLGMNQFQGPIPSSFSNFKSLQFLRLDGNNFSGKVDIDIFLGLKNLHTLLIGHNKLSVVDTNNNTNNILPELKHLGLASCNLKEFPTFLLFQHNMTALFLDNNQINGPIPVWIWNNSRETLQTIDLSYNFIDGSQQHLGFHICVHLEIIIISHNKLHGWLPVPPQATLVYDVSNNNLTGEIPWLICELRSLQLLDLSSNNMNGTLPPCLGRLSNSLMVLDLKRNNFHGTMMNTFSHACLLKRIDLSENQIQGQVPRSLANCTNLEILSLGDNSFDDVFPSWLGSLVELQVLILRSNKFHGTIEGLTTVSSQFLKLRIIDLSNNGFNGQLPHLYFQTWNAMKSAYIGKAYVMQTEISTKALSHTGKWPYSMTFTNKGVKTEYQHILDIFTAIDLSSNNFVGEISQSIQDLQGLESLNLSNNHLTGCVLPSLGSLKNLESLDLSRNELSGEIPQQLLQLDFLAILNVSFNHLNGSIPQGKQFNTFENNSYMGNPGLCGKPLSKVCRSLMASTPSSTSDESESLLPSGRIDWMVIFLGFGSGMVVGIVIGNILYTRYSECLIERFGKRKDRSIRPLTNKRRNHVLL